MSERPIRTLVRGSRMFRLSSVGATGALVAAIGVVWLSPSSAGEDVPAPTAQELALAAQVKQLSAQNANLRDSLEARQGELASVRASDAKASAERAAAKAAQDAADEKAAADRAAAQVAEDAAAQKASSERTSASRLGTQKAAAEREAAEQRGRERAAAAARAEARRVAEKAALEKALAGAEGDAQGAQIRAEEAAAAAARAQHALAQGQANAPAAPQPETKPTAPPRSELLAPALRYYGLYTPQSPFNWAEWDDVTSKVGLAPTVSGYFQGWDGDFRADAVTRSWAKGALPLLTWESRPLKAANDQAEDPDYSLPVIIGDPANGVPGRYDDYLHQYARDIVALGLPLAIRLDHEMNGSWYPWGERRWGGDSLNGNGKGDFVKMWRHVHDIFEAEGANQYVIWVWAPNIVNSLPSYAKNSSGYMKSLYPGDAYVDWVGLSGYYRPPYKSDQTPTFDYTYGPSLAQLRSITSKPILLAEIGASEVGGKKPAWVKDLFAGLARPENDDVIGFAWFNHTVTTISGGQRVTNDWRIASRGDSLAAFAAGIADPAAGFVPYPAGATASPRSSPAPTTAAPPPDPTPQPTPLPTPSTATATTPAPTPEPTPTATATPQPSTSASPTATPTP